MEAGAEGCKVVGGLALRHGTSSVTWAASPFLSPHPVTPHPLPPSLSLSLIMTLLSALSFPVSFFLFSHTGFL